MLEMVTFINPGVWSIRTSMAKLYDTTCYISGKRAGKGSPEGPSYILNQNTNYMLPNPKQEASSIYTN